MSAKFQLGTFVITARAKEAVPMEEWLVSLRRHASGDWGDLCPEDKAINERALLQGQRLLSVYKTKLGVRYYIITEADRSVTTVLLPDDY